MAQRLLLVDSDRSFLKEHQVSLEAAFDLEVVSSPEGVVAHLERGNFATVFICVEVADNKGYALCSTIRKNPKLDGVKIVLISAKATEEEYRRHQSLKGRADLYLHKPIAPSALVAALTPLVPGRALDPDNPLGELVDTELGDDWLDGLKNAMDLPEPDAVVLFEPPVPESPARKTVPPPTQDPAQVRRLEDRVGALELELREKDRRLTELEADLQRQVGTVTMNLDDIARRDQEAAGLKARLAEAEAALRLAQEGQTRDSEGVETLKGQLKDALDERAGLIQQVEALGLQVSDKTQRAIELLKDRDRLMRETMDLETHKTRVRELEALLAERDQALADRQVELDGALEAQGQLNATLEGLVNQHNTLEGIHQSALLEVAGHKEKSHLLQLELAGLEATMRGQGRDLAELGLRLQQLEGELAASQAQTREREEQIEARQGELQLQRAEVAQLVAQLAELRQVLDEATIQHEGERLELMNGLDQKEAELQRLNQALADQQDAHLALEREKQSLHGQLSEHRDRLQNLDALLQEIQDKLRRGSDLARG